MTLACMVPRRGSEASELDDATLEACRRGDTIALRYFVVHYQVAVFAFLSRALGSGPHVEDLAQDVFLRACRAIGTFDVAGEARLSTWLLTIARRLVIDARRKRRLPVAPIDLAIASSGTPETESQRREIARAFERAAAQLPDDQRDAFILTEFHGLTTKELATILGVPEATAKTRLFRARERLRIALRDMWEEG